MYQQQQTPYSQQQQQPQMHQNATTVVTSTGMQPAVVMSTPRTTLNVNTIKGLSIAQLVIGVITLGLGIGVLAQLNGYWVSSLSGGIWGGIWIIVTGILGICVALNPNNNCLVGTTMAFNIIATIIACIDGIIFLIGVIYTSGCNYNYYSYYDYYYHEYRYNYSYCYGYASSGSAMFGVLVTASGIEFFLALITAVYCCKGCCGTSSTGVIVQQAQPQYMVTSTAVGNMPPQSVYNTQGMQYSTNYQPQYQQQPYMAQAQAQGANTNVAYSTNPQEKQNLVQAEAPIAGFQQVNVSQAPPPYSSN